MVESIEDLLEIVTKALYQAELHTLPKRGNGGCERIRTFDLSLSRRSNYFRTSLPTV
nr:hypothetical protein [Candidatus Freyarchaeota archaeon]